MRVFGIAAILVLVLDQTTKTLVVFWMDLVTLRSIDVLPPLLNFRYGENRGINFGLFAGTSYVVRGALVALSLAISVVIVWWIGRRERPVIMYLSAGLLVGGALGNVLDRVLYGYVLDFLNMSCCGINNPYVFNVADMFIFAGALGLIVFDDRSHREAMDRKKAP